MTKTLQFLFAIFPCFGMLHAQPSITLEDMTPALGTSVTTSFGIYMSPGDEGADQTWNLGGMFSQNSSQSIYMLPDGLPGSGLFPNATHVAHSSSGADTYSYQTFENNLIEEQGYISSSQNTSLEIYFSDPRIQVQFPLNFGDTYSDTFASEAVNTYTIGQEPTTNIISEEGSFIAEVDGYGTLIIPTGTYENVLRVRYDVELEFNVVSDSVEVSSGERVIEEYRYYKAGYPLQLATLKVQTTYMMGEQVDQVASGNYLSESSVGLVESQDVMQNIALFPIPARSHLSAAMEVEQPTEAYFSLMGADGREIHTWPVRKLIAGSQQVELALPQVTTGMYLLQIRAAENVFTKPVMIEN